MEVAAGELRQVLGGVFDGGVRGGLGGGLSGGLVGCRDGVRGSGGIGGRGVARGCGGVGIRGDIGVGDAIRWGTGAGRGGRIRGIGSAGLGACSGVYLERPPPAFSEVSAYAVEAVRVLISWRTAAAFWMVSAWEIWGTGDASNSMSPVSAIAIARFARMLSPNCKTVVNKKAAEILTLFERKATQLTKLWVFSLPSHFWESSNDRYLGDYNLLIHKSVPTHKKARRQFIMNCAPNLGRPK